NADWTSVFKNAAPICRQVHLRIHCADGMEEKQAAVEPMAGMHYLTTSQRHRSCRIEIGYYQPADVWNSVAMSNPVLMLPSEMSESEHLDIATIPFHLSFQQLVDLFGVRDDALAAAISRFQTRAASEKLRSAERKILRHAGVALSELANAQHAFNQIDTERLKKRAEPILRSRATSPSRGFRSDWISAGS